MKNIIFSLVVSSFVFSSAAFADSRCGLYARLAASEAAVLDLNEFEVEAELVGYIFSAPGNGKEEEIFRWILQGEQVAIDVVTEYSNGQCVVLDSVTAQLR